MTRPYFNWKEAIAESAAYKMLVSGYSISDTPAVREAINDTLDEFEKSGKLSRKQTDLLSQDKLVKMVRIEMRQRLSHPAERSQYYPKY